MKWNTSYFKAKDTEVLILQAGTCQVIVEIIILAQSSWAVEIWLTSFLLPTHLPPPSCTHAQSSNPMDFSQPDSSVCGFFQARILEWVAISFSKSWFLKTKFFETLEGNLLWEDISLFLIILYLFRTKFYCPVITWRKLFIPMMLS